MRKYNVLLDAVLNYVNESRTTRGLPPLRHLLRGLRNDENNCPLANALDAEVSNVHVIFRDENAAMMTAVVWRTSVQSPNAAVMPYFLQKFVSIFDAGQLPELDIVELKPSGGECVEQPAYC